MHVLFDADQATCQAQRSLKASSIMCPVSLLVGIIIDMLIGCKKSSIEKHYNMQFAIKLDAD